MYFNDFINLEILIIIKMKNKEKKRYLKILIENIDRVVMFMVKVILFFIISIMLSLTLNVALASVLYKNWVDKQLHK